jgi:hypothetical protein
MIASIFKIFGGSLGLGHVARSTRLKLEPGVWTEATVLRLAAQNRSLNESECRMAGGIKARIANAAVHRPSRFSDARAPRTGRTNVNVAMPYHSYLTVDYSASQGDR